MCRASESLFLIGNCHRFPASFTPPGRVVKPPHDTSTTVPHETAPVCLTKPMLECSIFMESSFYQSAAVFVPIRLVDLSPGQLL